MKRFYPLVVLLVLLTACAPAPRYRTLPPVDEGSRQAEDYPQDMPAEMPGELPYPIQEAPPPAARGGGAVIALLDRADGYHEAGDYANEAATIERALRIDPNNARLWNRLAATRLRQGQPQQAEQLALKSNALAREDTALQVRNWRLVAEARRSMHDAAGARRADQKARELSRY